MTRHLWLALSLGLAAAQAALLVDTALDKSNTMDEEIYVGNAAHQWNGDFTCTPALPQWGFALALRTVEPTISDVPSDRTTQAGRRMMLYREPAVLRRNLHAARAATIVIVVLAGLLLWAAARRFGDRAAAVTHAMWCASPLVLAHGALAGVDGWAAAAMCLVSWCGVRLVERATLPRAAAAGAALGLAACAKLTALVALPVLIAAGVWAARRAGPPGAGRWPLRALRLVGLGAAGFLFTIWAVYGFRVAAIGSDAMCPLARLVWHGPAWPLPFPEWIESLLMQLRHGYETGHAGYLFGASSDRGWWWYYLASLALQTTLAAQAIAFFRVVATAVRRPPRRELLIDAALLAFPALLLLVLSAGRTQNGIKYLLPAYPFAMLWAGRAVLDVERLVAGRGRRVARAAGAALVAVLGLGAASMLAIHPHHLMYYNAWAGGPEGGPRYLVHGSDWGQDMRRLGQWQAEHGVAVINYLPYAALAPRWGIRYVKPSCRPAPGVYAIQAVHAYRPPPKFRGCFDWLTIEPPDERLGWSIFIYQVDQARLERLLAERGHVTPFIATGPAAP